MKSIKHIILFLGLVLSANLFAQHNEEVTIEGTYRPKVNKVDKILLKPDTPQQVFTIPEKEVKVQEIDRSFNLDLKQLSPLNYSTKKGMDENDANNNNFLMAAFGSRISPVFLFRHNSKLTKNWGFGVGLKHYSSWLDIKDYAPSGFMNNGVEIGLVHSKPNGVQVDGNVYYKHDTYHYYGINLNEWAGDSISLVHAAPQQVYNTIGAHFGVTPTTTRLDEALHKLDIDYHYLFGKVGNGKEHFAKMDYDLGVAKSWWGKKNYPQKLGVMLGAQFAFNEIMRQRGDDRILLKASPYFEMQNQYFRLHLGAMVDCATNFETVKEMFRIYPDVRGNLFVLDNRLEFYAGLNGGRKILTFSDLIEENPFVSTRLNMEVTTVKLGFEGGVRTNIMNTVDIHVGVRYRQTENDLFYRQYYMSPYDGMGMDRPQNSFDVIYDETQTLSVLGNVRWLVLDGLTVNAGFGYNKCDPSNEEHAWYRPTTEGNLGFNYQLLPELSFNASFIYQGGRWAQGASKLTPTYTTVKLKDIYDLGLGADYKVADKVTVFVKADNLLHRKYQLYLDYPVTGIEFFAGLKMAF